MTYPGPTTYPGPSLFPSSSVVVAPLVGGHRGTRLLIGELLTGRITVTLDGADLPTSLRWTDVLNGAGSIDGVTIPRPVVRKYNLRQQTHGVRCFLAVEVNGRIKQAGPIWSRTWDDDTGTLTLGASGLWSYFDKRIIAPIGSSLPYAQQVFTVGGASFGGLAHGLVANATLAAYGNVPVVLPDFEAGEHTESFWLYSLLTYGEQLRQITQRATDAPDIQFQARRHADDPRYLEWVMQVGTVARPALYQAGSDWVFDRTAPKSPVLKISTDEDANGMAEQAWATGEGQEQGTPMAVAVKTELNLLGWPLTETKDLHSSVSDLSTLQGHANSLVERVARPVEVLKVTARADTFNEVAAGDYAQTITKAPRLLPNGEWSDGDDWLGDMNARTRIRMVSGDLSDSLTFDMFPVLAAL